uniref:Transcription factor CBF/NF-Y/archaeal histone domain-containing protein n=1 Tax=Oryza barthii TaxID=65489 RepID=A0A0D3GFE0_9ORYZ
MEPAFPNGGAAAPPPPMAAEQPAAAAAVVREQDRLMPIANVIRIMRRVLPAHAKISDDAKETIQECVSEFISFVTGEANDRCHREHRKTVTAEDLVWAMDRLGFDDYVHHPVYAAPGEPVQGYGYPVAMSSALPAPHVHVGVRGGGQHEVFGGGPAPLAVYYGGAPYGEASSRGGCSAADEGSSSSSASPAPVGPNYE